MEEKKRLAEKNESRVRGESADFVDERLLKPSYDSIIARFYRSVIHFDRNPERDAFNSVNIF